MNYEEKKKAYLELVSDVHNCPKLESCNRNTITLHKCLECEEINLWSYWHGGVNNLNAKILVVGQDWGYYNIQTIKEWIPYFNKRNTDKKSKYPHPNPVEKGKTDSDLYEFFGYSKLDFDILCKNEKDLFFVNYVLCYRDCDGLGEITKNITRNCAEYFSRLVDIIEPNVIICLGQKTFDAVMEVFGQPVQYREYNDVIDNGGYKVNTRGYESVVFAVCHPSGKGIGNRTKIVAQNDWKRIGEYIRQNIYS